MQHLTLRQFASLLEDKSLSAQEMVSDQLARVEHHIYEGGNTYVNFQHDHEHERSMLLAQTADDLRQFGDEESRFSGLTVSINDSFDIQGERTLAGSVVLDDCDEAEEDADAVTRLKKSGLIPLGRTNMSEFGYSQLGINPHYGTPFNPIDASRIAGGASSGAAVSVALGMANVGLGTDTAGSLRISAAFCGLVGFKPSAYRVSTRGMMPLSWSLDSVGVIGNSVGCCAEIDAILSGEPLGEHFDQLPEKGKQLRLGVAEPALLDNLDKDVANAFDNVLSKLQDKGIELVDLKTTLLEKSSEFGYHNRLLDSEAHYTYGHFLNIFYNDLDPYVAHCLDHSTSLSAFDYLEAIKGRQELINYAGQALGSVDAWLMPTVDCLPPRISTLEHDPRQYTEVNKRISRNSSIINLIDGCAVSLPCQAAGELPVGLSVCGMSGDDQNILRIAHILEQLLSA